MARSRTAVAAESIKRYNTAYSAKKDFVAGPNAFLKQCLKRIGGSALGRKRGGTRRRSRKPSALDIGLGQGRNAVLLAQHGYDTTGIDWCDLGIRDGRRLAAARGMGRRINAVVVDAETFDYGRNRWDLIVLMYYPQPMFLMERLKRATRPGGHIVIERFSRPNHSKAAHAVDRRETKRNNPMLRSLADWHVLHYENDEFTSDWHWDGESPRGPIVRLLARKP